MSKPSPKQPFFDTSQWISAPGYSFLQPMVERISGITQLNDFHQEAGPVSGETTEFASQALRYLGVSWRLDAAQLPERDGRGWLVLGNHPTGLIEALVMFTLLERIALDDWALLGNVFVASKPEFASRAIALDPFNKGGGRRVNASGFRRAAKLLRSGGVVGAFPAGRVSGKLDRQGRAIDQAWSLHFVKLARATGAHILLAGMPWKPGLALRCFPPSWPSARALLLPREALRVCQREQVVRLRPAPTKLDPDARIATGQLQNFCHELHES
ncbi:MAG: hypothetical protein Q7Q71_16500 [Verrucomicrobiota bacterium JB023]|nr:hypothetical protein [Verrucomicrobiota bacterium JB023]